MATLSYHDIFDYPLKLEEIISLLIEKKASQSAILKEAANLQTQKKIDKKSEYYFLKSRPNLVATRISREKYSKKKLRKARFFASILKLIPTIRMVAVSGALAMKNSHKNDDIDLVIITSRGALWTTRFFSNLLLLPFKRDSKGQKISDRACLNLFLDESALRIKEQNLYTSHEICQMKLLWDRDNTHQRFLKANSWTKNHLPSWEPELQNTSRSYKRGRIPSMLSVIEKPLKSLQLWYMESRITSEKIEDKQLFFHPKSTQGQVLASFHKKIKTLRIRTT